MPAPRVSSTSGSFTGSSPDVSAPGSFQMPAPQVSRENHKNTTPARPRSPAPVRGLPKSETKAGKLSLEYKSSKLSLQCGCQRSTSSIEAKELNPDLSVTDMICEPEPSGSASSSDSSLSDSSDSDESPRKRMSRQLSKLSSQTSADALSVGDYLWIPCDKEVWRAAVVVGKDDKKAVVQVRGSEENVVLDLKAADGPVYLPQVGEFLSSEAAKSVQDLSCLPQSSEPEVLKALESRFGDGIFYASAGTLLLAMNPYQETPGLYSEDRIQDFAIVGYGEALSPHVFGTAQNALLGIQYGGMAQTLLVLGESGAGKTETAKLAIRFLAAVAGRELVALDVTEPEAPNVTVEHCLVQSAPLIEALGNACTPRNANSSRFGKFVELEFAVVGSPCIRRAETHTLLLEKWRISDLKEGERSFHVFYQILAAAARARKQHATPQGQTRAAAADPFAPKHMMIDRPSGVSNVEWDPRHSDWRVYWTKQGKERSKVFAPCSFLQPGMETDAADKAAMEAAVAYRHDLARQGLIQAAQLPLTDSIPELKFGDHVLVEWMHHKFEFLARSTCEILPGVDEAAKFDETIAAMQACHMTDDEIMQVVCALVAILYLGNMKFENLPGKSDASRVKDWSEPDGPLCSVSGFLGVERDKLASALCTRELQEPGSLKSNSSRMRQAITPSQAADSRDVLARHIYAALFDYVVSRMNEALPACDPRDSDDNHETGSLPVIGVLDMFGFAASDDNCFEQFCINYVNEVLQQHFISVVFEQLVLYKDNQVLFEPHEVPIQELVAHQRLTDSGILFFTGAFSKLDQESDTDGGTAESWLYKVSMTMSYGSNGAFELVHDRPGRFSVEHFARPVEYCADEFLERNRDALGVEVLECMRESANSVIRYQFSSTDDVLPSKGRSVSGNLRKQLAALQKKISASQSHFVRCIRSNQTGEAHSFDRHAVVQQLRCQGILEAVRVARVGYAMSMTHRQAVMTYWTLATRRLAPCTLQDMHCDMYCEASKSLFKQLEETLPGLPSGSIQVGTTSTFFKTEALEVLGKHLRRAREGGALQIQAAWRRHWCYLQFDTLRTAALILQTHGRARAARKLASELRRERAAVRLQAAWRSGHDHRARSKQVLRSASVLQHHFRNRLASKRRHKDTAQRLTSSYFIIQEALGRLSHTDVLEFDRRRAQSSRVLDAISSIEQAADVIHQQSLVLASIRPKVIQKPAEPAKQDSDEASQATQADDSHKEELKQVKEPAAPKPSSWLSSWF